jgi:hypothetical protein
MARKTVTFTVEFELPHGASMVDCVDYIETALKSECGIRHPDDPMHDFNRKSVKVVGRQR